MLHFISIKRASFSALALALSLNPLPALAESLTGGGSDLDLFAGMAMGAILAGLVALRLLDKQKRKQQEMQNSAERLQQMTAQFTQLFLSCPDPVFYWSRITLNEAASPKLTDLLELPAAAKFKDVLEQLEEKDAEALNQAVKSLRRSHQFFDMDVTTKQGRSLTLVGRVARMNGSQGTPLAHAVWFRNG